MIYIRCILLGCIVGRRQVVRHQVLVLAFRGSNPFGPAKKHGANVFATLTHIAGAVTFKSMNKRAYGFTIVELLIVIVVIAILATVTIVAYNGIRARAERTVNLAAVRNYVQVLQLMKADTGSLPAANSCLGPSGIYAGGTCAFSGQNGTVNATTNSQLAQYGLTSQPAIKNNGQQVVAMFVPAYYGEPALIYTVPPTYDCVAVGSRLYVTATSSWTDGSVYSSRISTETRCYLSLALL